MFFNITGECKEGVLYAHVFLQVERPTSHSTTSSYFWILIEWRDLLVTAPPYQIPESSWPIRFISRSNLPDVKSQAHTSTKEVDPPRRIQQA